MTCESSDGCDCDVQIKGVQKLKRSCHYNLVGAALKPYRYACHFADIMPTHLPPNAKGLASLDSNGVGPLSPAAAKTFTKFTRKAHEIREGLAERERLCRPRLAAIPPSRNALRFVTATELGLAGFLRGIHWTPLVEPEGSRSTHRLRQLKMPRTGAFLIGGEGGILKNRQRHPI